MKIIEEYGNEDLAKVYVARMRDEDSCEDESRKFVVEFVESTQPPLPRNRKWVLIISSMFGCPVNCRFCDAGGEFSGKLSAEEILDQVMYMVRRRFPDGRVPVQKFKIQFARMGEPSLNPAVLDVMERLPGMLDAPGLYISLSTVAPSSRRARDFFENLITIKERNYPGGRFQMQFSIHTTDVIKRDELIPIKKWSFEEIAAYGERFCNPKNGDKKVTLNFAVMDGYPIEAGVIKEYFDPAKFIIKLTPLNPTVRAFEESLRSGIDPHDESSSMRLVRMFEREGYDVILSIGELEENLIGSNCGQFVQRVIRSDVKPENSYELEKYCLNSEP